MAILNDATAIYAGSTPVDKIMVGAIQVWPDENLSAPNVPVFTQISVDNNSVTHEFSEVPNATLYRIEIEKVG